MIIIFSRILASLPATHVPDSDQIKLVFSLSVWGLGCREVGGLTTPTSLVPALPTYWNWDDTKTNMENVDGNLSPVYIPT